MAGIWGDKVLTLQMITAGQTNTFGYYNDFTPHAGVAVLCTSDVVIHHA